MQHPFYPSSAYFDKVENDNWRTIALQNLVEVATSHSGVWVSLIHWKQSNMTWYDNRQKTPNSTGCRHQILKYPFWWKFTYLFPQNCSGSLWSTENRQSNMTWYDNRQKTPNLVPITGCRHQILKYPFWWKFTYLFPQNCSGSLWSTENRQSNMTWYDNRQKTPNLVPITGCRHQILKYPFWWKFTYLFPQNCSRKHSVSGISLLLKMTPATPQLMGKSDILH